MYEINNKQELIDTKPVNSGYVKCSSMSMRIYNDNYCGIPKNNYSPKKIQLQTPYEERL